MTIRSIQVALIDSVLTILGLAVLGFGVFAVYRENLGLAGTALAAGLILLFAATIHRFESLKGLGMEAKTRKLDETIDKAEIALSKLKELTELVGANLIRLSSSIGRWSDAPSIMDAYALSRQVRKALEGVGANESTIRDALQPWAHITAADVFHASHEVLREILDAKRLELGRLAAQPSAAGAEAAQLTARLQKVEGFLSKKFEDMKTWRIEDFSPRLLERLSEAPELDENDLSTLGTRFRKAAEQIGELARTFDFSDMQYWKSQKRVGETI